MTKKFGKRVGQHMGALMRYMERKDDKMLSDLYAQITVELDRKTQATMPGEELAGLASNLMDMIDETALYMCGLSMRHDPDNELFTALAKAGFHMGIRAEISEYLARFEDSFNPETVDDENGQINDGAWGRFIEGLDFDNLPPFGENDDDWEGHHD